MKPYGISSEILQIQLEIMNNGPVEACFAVYEDFLHYKSGTLYVFSNNINFIIYNNEKSSVLTVLPYSELWGLEDMNYLGILTNI